MSTDPIDFAPLRESIQGLQVSMPLADLVYYRPLTLTFDSGDVALAALSDVADFVMTSTVPDDQTRLELMTNLIALCDKLRADPTRSMPKRDDGKLVFDAPSWLGSVGNGSIARKERTPEEKVALLADPNLPLDVRNEFEQALGLPLTPAPESTAQFAFPLPQLFDEKGTQVDYSRFSRIEQRTDGSTVMIWGGPDVLTLSRLVTGGGDELPVLPGALAMNGAITLPLNKKNLKVQANGLLIRDGKVVRDGEVASEQVDADAKHEADLRAGIISGVSQLIVTKASLTTILGFVKARGYTEATATEIMGEAFALAGIEIAGWPTV